ncbi:hypothetical protein NF868_04015 [Bacillus zhangzhouensis]|nr:hypothetical protein NF868_04015 [Bacillus zhangzhouensis]
MNEKHVTMHVFNIISLQTPNVEVVENIVKERTKKLIFYFMPDTTIDGLHAVIIAPNDTF